MSLEIAYKVIVPQKKNYVPQFLKQRYINSYSLPGLKQVGELLEVDEDDDDKGWK